MTEDTLTSADPLEAGHPDLDPDSPAARRVLMAARSAPVPVRRKPRTKLALAGAMACAVAVAAIAIGVPGGSSGPADARAQLISAAEKTAAFTTGKVTWRMIVDGTHAKFTADATNTVKFDGDALETAYVSDSRDVDGVRHQGSGGFIFAGGRNFSREGDGPWKEFTIPQDRGGPPNPREELRAQLGAADALADVAKAAPGVTREEHDGTTTYRASVPGTAVPVALGPNWKDDSEPTSIEVVVGEDGVVRSAKLAGGGDTRAIVYEDLGAPQGIAIP